jgi:hypothetical protein
MPGAGPAPKLPEQRRRRNVPERGEWVNLEPLEAPVLPLYEQTFQMPQRLWNAWREDPITSQYGDTDIAMAIHFAEEFRDFPPAQRIALMDKLGMTPKGKRDLRWRTPNEVKTIAKQADKAAVRRLHAVGKTKK